MKRLNLIINKPRSIRRNLIVSVVLLIIFSLITISVVNNRTNTKAMISLQEDLLNAKLNGDSNSLNNTLEAKYGKLYTKNNEFHSSHEVDAISTPTLVDGIAEDLGVEITLFIKDETGEFKSITTSISDKNGEKLTGNYLLNDNGVVDVLKEGKTYIGKDNVGGIAVQSLYKPMKNGREEIIGAQFVGIPTKSMEEHIEIYTKETAKGAGIIGMIVLTIAVSLLYLISFNISTPINLVSKELDRLSEYDLSISNSTELRNLKFPTIEVVTMTNSIEKLRNNLSTTISLVIDSTNKVNDSSHSLKESTSQSVKVTEEVAMTIEDIAMGASQQAQDTETVSNEINNLIRYINQNGENTSQLEYAFNEIQSEKDRTVDVVNCLLEETEKSLAMSQKVLEAISMSRDNANEIEENSENIRSIASQTNLLALNATIEAARAGESGRGFAVVAEEIRKLSLETDRFNSEIVEAINKLVENTKNAYDTMIEAGIVTGLQGEYVGKTNSSLNEISNTILNTEESLSNLINSSELLLQSSDNISTITQNLAAIAEENSAGTEQTSASVQQMSAGIEEISSASESLGELAKDLKLELDKFKMI